MKKILAGFAWILFGVLLALIGLQDPWFPVIGRIRELWSCAGLLCGGVGLALALLGSGKKD